MDVHIYLGREPKSQQVKYCKKLINATNVTTFQEMNAVSLRNGLTHLCNTVLTHFLLSTP